MSFDAIGAIGALTGVGGVGGASALSGPTFSPDAGTTAATSGTDFAALMGKGIDGVQAAQTNADNLAVQAAAGTLTDPSQLTIAATQASLMTSLATTLSSKAVQAFNQIMSMQA